MQIPFSHIWVRLLFSLPPELNEKYWSEYFSYIAKEKDMIEFIAGNKLEEVIEIAENNYTDWDPNKPYWENQRMKKNG